MQFADNFALKGDANCSINASNTDVNITLPNGMTYQGLTNEWKTPFDGSSTQFKNVVVDIDGQKGKNKLWIDRFPMRIYREGDLVGVVALVDCSDDNYYNTDTDPKVILETKSFKKTMSPSNFFFKKY